MKAISVRAPWWYAILHLGKDIENRDWYTNQRGTVWLHAAKWHDEFGISDVLRYDVAPMYREAKRLDLKLPVGSNQILMPPPVLDDFKAARGCLVGKVDIVGCVMSHASPWFCGKHGFVLANPVALPKPIPFKGALGFFEVPDDIEHRFAMAEGFAGSPESEIRSAFESGAARGTLFDGRDLASRDDIGTIDGWRVWRDA